MVNITVTVEMIDVNGKPLFAKNFDAWVEDGQAVIVRIPAKFNIGFPDMKTPLGSIEATGEPTIHDDKPVNEFGLL